MSGEGSAKAPAELVPVSFPDANIALQRRSERRVLTALCYDLVGSTELLAVLDIEEFEGLLAAFQQAVRRAITSHGGAVRDETGDGGLALFPTDIDAKDAASLAISAGLEIVETCKDVGLQQGHADLHVRVGIATSMSLIHDGQEHAIPDSVTGAALAMATRLQAIAGADTVFVSHETRSLARRSHVFSFRGERVIKGFPEPERVWQAVRHKREVDRFFAFGRLSSPLIGRKNELSTIAECWARAAAGNGEVLLIDGEAGIGKSRLVYELRRMTRRRRSKLLLFQCLPGGLRSALHPLLQNFPAGRADSARRPTMSAVAELFGSQGVVDTDIVDIFSFLLGAEGTKQGSEDVDLELIRERANWAIQRAIEMLCAEGPLVLVVEDIHWIDPTSMQLLTEAARVISAFPALLVVTTRNLNPTGWLEASKLRLMSLRPLDREETRLAVTSMWPESRSSSLPGFLDAMARVTGGVPIFIEEICQWMSENAGSETHRLAQAASPGRASTFEGILNARLEPLGPARDVAHAASVAGNRFDQRLLNELLPGYDAQTIDNALDALSEAGFLTRVRPSALPAYGFRHALIQETIYNSLLRTRRQAFHRRLFAALTRDRNIAPWIGTVALAERAERAGMLESAIDLLVAAGTESYARSAMVEAQHLLEHALALCMQIGEPDKQETLRLSAMAALGPVLTSTEGPSSFPARKLYEDGVEIARKRPLAERARWFPLFWGWWFTGTDVNGVRAQAVLNDLKDVDDPEVQLQARHCVWAIDFYLGRHESCIAAVDTGLFLYRTGQGKENVSLFGGHDAKVCGLSHRGLSQWFIGRTSSAIHSLSEARRWAQQTGHAGSIAHAYNNEAMLYCYRRDFAALRTVIADIRQLTEGHHLPSLAATAEIFEGWCEGNSGHIEQGKEMIRQGLAVHAELQTPEDYPVYCGMLAELLEHTGDVDEALDLLSTAASEAEKSGHRYWLAELHRRRARLMFQHAPDSEVLDALADSLAIASEQNAVPILLAAYDMLVSFGLSRELASRYRDRVDRAKSALEPGEVLVVNPEPMPRGQPSK
ncbi:ATP-binding protein [Allomesorhizobium camelthorni]|uniref:AAA family ATPase n=1 Tax=Allomesorhizobium camelthorni TaxID=475069 RepID=A0A6G4WD54_9HYPH|nr:AAA family ATPase [Mesorhizobium camelthorni]NGO52166.1 AAA family ATPase [Mesorhizobium camelthorni]